LNLRAIQLTARSGKRFFVDHLVLPEQILWMKKV